MRKTGKGEKKLALTIPHATTEANVQPTGVWCFIPFANPIKMPDVGKDGKVWKDARFVLGSANVESIAGVLDTEFGGMFAALGHGTLDITSVKSGGETILSIMFRPDSKPTAQAAPPPQTWAPAAPTAPAAPPMQAAPVQWTPEMLAAYKAQHNMPG